MEDGAFAVETRVVALAVSAGPVLKVDEAVVQLVLLGAEGASQGFRFACTALMAKALAFETPDGLLFGLFGDGSFAVNGRTFAEDRVCCFGVVEVDPQRRDLLSLPSIAGVFDPFGFEDRVGAESVSFLEVSKVCVIRWVKLDGGKLDDHLVRSVLDAGAGAYVRGEASAVGFLSEPVGRGLGVEFEEEASVAHEGGRFDFGLRGGFWVGDGPGGVYSVGGLSGEGVLVHDVEI